MTHKQREEELRRQSDEAMIKQMEEGVQRAMNAQLFHDGDDDDGPSSAEHLESDDEDDEYGGDIEHGIHHKEEGTNQETKQEKGWCINCVYYIAQPICVVIFIAGNLHM